MKWIKWLFYIAGGYGVLVITPQYFLEERISMGVPPPITHPEYFYGFIGVGLAWQIAFIIIGTDPLRYRHLMLAGVVEKFSFGIAAALLYQAGRVRADLVAFGSIDMLLGVLFIVAWVQLGKEPAARVGISSPRAT